jgi:hypothetical protein
MMYKLGCVLAITPVRFTTFSGNIMSKQLKTTITKSFANQVTGGLGKPSKMPGTAYGIPAAECITGSKLRKVAGSTCSDCYALKGRYAFANVVNAEYLRLDRVQQALDDHAFRAVYVDCFAFLLLKVDWHRWHDAGDLQSVEHFDGWRCVLHS